MLTERSGVAGANLRAAHVCTPGVNARAITITNRIARAAKPMRRIRRGFMARGFRRGAACANPRGQSKQRRVPAFAVKAQKTRSQAETALTSRPEWFRLKTSYL